MCCVHQSVLLLSVAAQLISGNGFITFRAQTQEATAVCLMQSKVGFCNLLVAKRERQRLTLFYLSKYLTDKVLTVTLADQSPFMYVR